MSDTLSAATTALPAAKPLAALAKPLAALEEPDAGASLRIVRSIADIRVATRAARCAGLTIGFVPTMGALHEGHLSLIRAARLRCDLVVVSVFVNPRQFNEQADLAAYPRNEERDAALAESAGADIMFAPSPEEIYRPGFSTGVEVHGLTDRLEGAMRGKEHFQGVTTVVCKLLNIVAPDIAYFGQKDAQQVAVVRRMVDDLDIDVQIETVPTAREADGLAMSSRNVRLTPPQRKQALALHAALLAAQRLAASGERSCATLVQEAARTFTGFDVRPDYVALVDPQSFHELNRLQDAGLMLVAARVGQTRLIDNLLLRALAPPQQQPIHANDREGAVIA